MYTVILRWVFVTLVDFKNCTQSECVYLALSKQHAKRMRYIILSYPILSHKRNDFQKKNRK
jgi:hypothetical protein